MAKKASELTLGTALVGLLVIASSIPGMAQVIAAGYQGDWKGSTTHDCKFTTNVSTLGVSVPTTFTGTPIIKIYKDSSTSTETATGITHTEDFDSITGLNDVSIDTSDAFYSAGSDFSVIITQGTLGGTSIAGTVVCSFSILFRPADVGYINGGATDGNNATLYLKKLSIVNATDSDPALNVQGQTAAVFTGTSGNAVYMSGSSGHSAMLLSGGGAGRPYDLDSGLIAQGTNAQAGATIWTIGNGGPGLLIQGGDAADAIHQGGDGIRVYGGAGDGSNPGRSVLLQAGEDPGGAHASGLVVLGGGATSPTQDGAGIVVIGQTNTADFVKLTASAVELYGGIGGTGLKIRGGISSLDNGGYPGGVGSSIEGGASSEDDLVPGMGIDIHGGETNNVSSDGATAVNIWGGDSINGTSGIGLSISNEAGGSSHPALLVAPNGGNTDAIKLVPAGTGIGLHGSSLTPQKNKATLFPLVMYDTAGNPKSGLTVSCQTSLDGAAWANCAGAIAEVGDGGYVFSAAAADMNAAAMILKFTASGARPLMVSILTQP